MVVKTENIPHYGGFIVSEANGTYARERITIAMGQVLRAGAVIADLGGGEWEQLDPAASTGAEAAAGILIGDVDATEAATDGVAIVRGPCEVDVDELVWPDGIQAGEITAALAELLELGIVARSGPATLTLGANTVG